MNQQITPDGYGDIHAGIVALLEEARRAAARSVNAVMTASYWDIGRRIVEAEQGGQARAEYGKALLKRLSADLTTRFGRGFSERNLEQMRGFYLYWPPEQISQTVSAKLGEELVSASPSQVFIDLPTLAKVFPLPWSAYVRLLSVKNTQARAFYETEALRGGWSVRQLDRQINSQFYERLALSRNLACTSWSVIPPRMTTCRRCTPVKPMVWATASSHTSRKKTFEIGARCSCPPLAG